jgi:alpha-mannosidase
MKLDTIYVIHHTHTDIGFTNDQPVFWEMQYRFIDEALRLIDAYAEFPADCRFRWTVETTCGLDAWLKTASSRDIDRLINADKAGLLEVMAMQTNNTPLFNTAQMIDSLRPINRLRNDYGLNIRYAMNCDVNGQNWTLADILLDAGIEGFSMAINHHFGGPPNPRPNVFLWQAPSGRLLPTHNGWQYSKANDFGLAYESDEVLLEWLPQIEAYLTEIDYPLPFIILEGYHPYGDNGSAWGAFAEFAQRWNDSGHTPHIVSATPRMFWERVKNHHADLQAIRGDWTDYWNFGCISSARETSIVRTTRSRLYRSDALFAMLNALTPKLSQQERNDPLSNRDATENEGISEAISPLTEGRARALSWSDRTFSRYREAAWDSLNLYCEHTWGADTASNEPQLEDSLAMDNHKKNLAYTARSLSLLLERDAIADFSHYIPRNDVTDLLLFNPLPWERTVYGFIPKNVLIPRGLNDDTTSSRHFIGRMAQPTDFWTGRAETGFHGGIGWMLKPTPIPAFGYTVVSWDSLAEMASAVEGKDAIIENQRYRITFDSKIGGITSLYDKQIDYEWVDSSAGYPLHSFVHEEVADHSHSEPRKLLCNINWSADTKTTRCWNPGWNANRTTPIRVIYHKTYQLPFAKVVEQILEHPLIGKISQRVFLPDSGDLIEFQSEWQMGSTIHPEATYLLFPFNLPKAQARFDIGSMAVRPNLDQLPGVCRDYFTVQGWVDFNDGVRGVTIATPENPMVQLGDFHFAHNQSEARLERALLLGWVTNNYWETNFPGNQPGVVTARYSIMPYEGGFNESRAHKFAAESEHTRPTVQHLGETPNREALPASGTLLQLPQLPVCVLSLRAIQGKGILLILLNASDDQTTACISSGVVKIQSMQLCDVFGNYLEQLVVKDGAVEVLMKARQTVNVIMR